MSVSAIETRRESTNAFVILKPDLRNEKGAIFTTDLNISHLFEFYYVRKRDFKDGTSRWDLCVALKGNTSDTNYIYLDKSFRGSEDEAKKRLEDIVFKGF